MGYKEDFIAFMVRSDVLCFGSFQTKSGRTSPYFINAGNYCTGAQASLLGEYYASCIMENMPNFDLLYGPAYKGIPLAVSTSVALYRKFGVDRAYCFNRKETKDHGEGGLFIGKRPKDGDKVVLIDDVVTAGLSLKESISLLKNTADVQIAGLFISVDRMERGAGLDTVVHEIGRELGIPIFPIITIREIINYLYKKEIDGSVFIDDAVLERMEQYLKKYGGCPNNI